MSIPDNEPAKTKEHALSDLSASPEAITAIRKFFGRVPVRPCLRECQQKTLLCQLNSAFVLENKNFRNSPTACTIYAPVNEELKLSSGGQKEYLVFKSVHAKRTDMAEDQWLSTYSSPLTPVLIIELHSVFDYNRGHGMVLSSNHIISQE